MHTPVALLLAGSILSTPVGAFGQPRPSAHFVGMSSAETGVCPRLAEDLDAFAAELLEAGLPGVVIGLAARDGEPLIRAYGLADVEHEVRMKPGSVFRIASLTKPFTAAAVLALVAEGRLALETRAADVLPELPWLGEITIEQLLNHTAGLADYADDGEGHATRAVARSGAEMVAWIEGLDPRTRFAPGTSWEYSNSHYVLLGLIIERTTGLPFEQILMMRVMTPAGLQETSVDDPTDLVSGRVRGYSRAQGMDRPRNAAWIHPSIPGPAGSLRSTAAEILAFNQALFAGRLIPPGLIDRMTSPGLLNDGRANRWGMPEAWRLGLNSDYGLGVFSSPSPIGLRVWHSGDIDGFSSWMAHWPEVGLSAVVLTNGDFHRIDPTALEAALGGYEMCSSVRRDEAFR